MKFFIIDGPFYKYGTLVFDLILLNLIWLIISVISLGILMGNATVALQFAVNKCVIKGEGHPIQSFLSKMKLDFFRTTLFSLVLLLVLGISIYNVIIVVNIATQLRWMLLIYLAIPVYILAVSPYLLILLAQTRLKVKQLLAYSFIFAIKHFGATLVSFFLLILFLICIYYTSFFGLLFLVAPYIALCAKLISSKVLIKYSAV